MHHFKPSFFPLKCSTATRSRRYQAIFCAISQDNCFDIYAIFNLKKTTGKLLDTGSNQLNSFLSRASLFEGKLQRASLIEIEQVDYLIKETIAFRPVYRKCDAKSINIGETYFLGENVITCNLNRNRFSEQKYATIMNKFTLKLNFFVRNNGQKWLLNKMQMEA